MRVLLDTVTFIWAVSSPELLSASTIWVPARQNTRK